MCTLRPTLPVRCLNPAGWLLAAALCLPGVGPPAGAQALDFGEPAALEGGGARAWGPDGRWLLLGTGPLREPGAPAALRRYDAASGRLLASYPGLPGDPADVAVSPDGRRVAAAVGAEVLEWSLEGAPLARHQTDLQQLMTVAYQRGRLVATGRRDPGDHRAASTWSEGPPGPESEGAPLPTPDPLALTVVPVPGGARVVDDRGRPLAALVGLEALEREGVDRGFQRRGATVLRAYAGSDHTALWRLEEGPRFEVQVPSAVQGLSLSPAGDRLLSWGDEALLLWDLDGRWRRALWRGGGRPSAAAWGPGGQLALGREDGALELRDRDGALLHTAAAGGGVTALAFDDRGALAVASADGLLTLWTPGQGAALLASGVASATSLLFSPDGRYLAAAADGALVILDREGTPRLSLALEAAPALRFDERGELWVIEEPAGVRIADPESGAVRSWPLPAEAAARREAFAAITPPRLRPGVRSEDGRVEAALNQGRLEVRLGSLERLLLVDGVRRPAGLLLGPDGALVAHFPERGCAIWDLALGEPRAWLPPLQEPPALLPNGALLGLQQTGELSAWALADGAHITTLGTPLAGWLLSREGGWLATADGQRVRTWDLETLAPLAAVDAPGVQRLEASAGGRWLLVEGREGLALDPRTGRPLPQLEGASPGALELSPDGATLAFARGDRPALMDLATGAVREGTPAPGPLQRLRFSSDGRSLWARVEGRREPAVWSSDGEPLDPALAGPAPWSAASRPPPAATDQAASPDGRWRAWLRADGVLRASGPRQLALAIFSSGNWCLVGGDASARGEDPLGQCQLRRFPSGEATALLGAAWPTLEPDEPAADARSDYPPLAPPRPAGERPAPLRPPPWLPPALALAAFGALRRARGAPPAPAPEAEIAATPAGAPPLDSPTE